MDLYINTLSKYKFKLLNRFWDELGYGSPHIVGLLFAMIETNVFSNWAHWERHYFSSGKTRLSLLEKLSRDFKEKALNPNGFNKNEIKWPVYKINYFYGRTRNEIKNIIQSLYFKQINEHTGDINCDLNEIEEFVRFKIFGEPWNHKLLRYTKTIKKIRLNLPELQIKRARLPFVDNYGFQGLITKNGKPKAGIGVKSAGWLKQANLLHHLDQERAEKVHLYQDNFGSDVYTFYANLDGEIINSNEQKRLEENCFKYIIPS